VTLDTEVAGRMPAAFTFNVPAVPLPTTGVVYSGAETAELKLSAVALKLNVTSQDVVAYVPVYAQTCIWNVSPLYIVYCGMRAYIPALEAAAR
jgi:hypothetical protein